MEDDPNLFWFRENMLKELIRDLRD